MFITIEGVEGSGKSTLLNGLKKMFETNGEKVVATREPGGCPYAELIREEIMNNKNLTLEDEIKMFIDAREHHNIEVIKPAMEEGNIILCDRYIHSNMIYQGYLHNGLDGARSVYEYNKKSDIIMPDLTIFLNIRPEIGLNRIYNNNRNTNRFDDMDISIHNKIYEGYLRILSDDILGNRMIGINVENIDIENMIQFVYLIIDEMRKEK